MDVDLTCNEPPVEELSDDNGDDVIHSEDDASNDKSWGQMREEALDEDDHDNILHEQDDIGAVQDVSTTEYRHRPGTEYQFQLLPVHVQHKGDSRTGIYKVFKCDICGMVYRHVFSLKRHFLRCHINYKYLTATDITNCGIHLQVIQAAQNDSLKNGDDLYRCHSCNKLFPEREQLKVHTESHLNSKGDKKKTGVSCNMCNSSFADRKSLLRHQASFNVHHQPAGNSAKKSSNNCKHCSKAFSNINDLRKHEKWHESFTGTCQVCDKTFSSGDYFVHKSQVHPDINHLCSYCPTVFPDVGALGQHLFAAHGKTYSENVNQIKSKEVEIKEEPSEASLEGKPDKTSDAFVRCELCNKSFTTLVNLQRHNTVVHVKQLDKRSPQDTNRHRHAPSGQQKIPTEEEFYRTLATRISENLQYHIDGRTPGAASPGHGFEAEKVEGTASGMPWLVNNFPPTLDITHIVQIYANRTPLSSTHQTKERIETISEDQLNLGAHLGLNPVKKEIKKENKTLFICQACGATEFSLRAIHNHKKMQHPGVTVTHLELEGHSTVPPELALTFSRSAHGLLKSAVVNRPDVTVLRCTKCAKMFTKTSDLHSHILQCGSRISINGSSSSTANPHVRPSSPRLIKQRKFGPVLNTKRPNIEDNGLSVASSSSLYLKDDPRRKRGKLDDRPQRRSARSTYSGSCECNVCGHIFQSTASLRKHMLDECREEPAYRRKKVKKESPNGTPEPIKITSSDANDDFLDGKSPDQFQCRDCTATFGSIQFYQRHLSRCSAMHSSTANNSYVKNKSPFNGQSCSINGATPTSRNGVTSFSSINMMSNARNRSEYEEMTMQGLLRRAERDRHRESDDDTDEEATKVYRCPNCQMGFGDYVKMLHHCMDEHGTQIPDVSSGASVRNVHNGSTSSFSQRALSSTHRDYSRVMREEIVYDDNYGDYQASQSSQSSSLYDSEDIRDKERIAIEALSSIHSTFFSQAQTTTPSSTSPPPPLPSSSSTYLVNSSSYNNNNNNNNNEVGKKFSMAAARHQTLMDHRY